MPQLSAEQIAEISRLVAQYIIAQREGFSPQAVPLDAAQRAAIAGFFLPQALDAASVLVLHGKRVENPPFYPMLAGMGFSGLPDFSQMAAITFRDVVVSHVSLSDGLLFHELVHVEQYRQLGIPRFAELYVQGFLAGGGYDAIPLESNAYALGRRFEGNPRQRFSVAEEVGKWVRENSF
ncbi:MAG: hypothetical protein LAP13_14925 [Acidobacteriia bacterium]|nr:hypothetical protein [Terriglobia bacterium]